MITHRDRGPAVHRRTQRCRGFGRTPTRLRFEEYAAIVG